MDDKVPIYDVENIVRKQNFYMSENVANNRAYGYLHHIKHYAGIDDEVFLNCVIVHGIGLYENVDDREFSHNCRNVLVAGDYGKNAIKKYTGIDAVCIGPYIAYADNYYMEEEILEEKIKNGRTLLIFPFHGDRMGGNRDESIKKKISEMKDKFDTILACIYHDDVRRGYHNIYLDCGCKVVTAGDWLDCDFISRLKTIIELSDGVMVDSFTTGLVFAVYMGRPVYFWESNIEYCDKYWNGSSSIITKNTKMHVQFRNISGNPNFDNYDEQRNWFGDNFGFEYIKSKSDMKELLNGFIRG